MREVHDNETWAEPEKLGDPPVGTPWSNRDDTAPEWKVDGGRAVSRLEDSGGGHDCEI